MKKMNEVQWARYLAGEMSPSEEINFRQILEEGLEEGELNKMENIWKQFKETEGPGNGDAALAWKGLRGRLAEDGLLVKDSVPVRRMQAPGWKVAATILLVLAIGFPALYYGWVREGPSRVHVAEKGLQTVDLPDGSRVFLNQGSEISFPRQFEVQRSVELEGEAFFEVMSDPVNPFTVRSGKVVVSVLGTSFNVKTESATRDVEVYVESGKVRVALADSDAFLTLEPGEYCLASEKGLLPLKQVEDNYISWKTKDFKFVDEELGKVLRELEESYHVVIHTGEVPMEDKRITTTYSEQSIDAILETIGTAFDLKVSKREGQYYLNN
jgi:ferric-dicitrate binding protein FerR (iron transport regulator)